MVRVGVVGIGFMGMIHFQALKRIADAQVTAIATRDPKKRAGDWTGIQGNFGPRGEQENLAGITTFADWRELVRSADVDLVDVCLPNDQHAEVVIAALEAGKDVLVEKPIALSLAEADRMVAAARSAGRLLLVAHVLPFFAEFEYAARVVREETFGRLRGGHFRRLISPPDWSAAIADLERTGGPIIDLHIHDTHFIGLLAGPPSQVLSRGRLREETVEYVVTQYHYEDPSLTISAASGAISPASRPFTHGFEIYLENAMLTFEAGQPLRLWTEKEVSEPQLASSDPVDAFARELTAAVRSVRTRQPSPMLSAELARGALALCLCEAKSVRTGQAVAVT